MLKIVKVSERDNDNECYNVFIDKFTKAAIKWFNNNPKYSHEAYDILSMAYYSTPNQKEEDRPKYPDPMFFMRWTYIKEPHFSVFNAEDQLAAYARVQQAIEEYKDVKSKKSSKVS